MQGEASSGSSPAPRRRWRGREDLDRPFQHKRTIIEGDPVSEALGRATTVREAAKYVIALFGVPRRYAAFILRLDVSNGIKMMKLAKSARYWRRFWTTSGRVPKRTSQASGKIFGYRGPLD